MYLQSGDDADTLSDEEHDGGTGAQLTLDVADDQRVGVARGRRTTTVVPRPQDQQKQHRGQAHSTVPANSRSVKQKKIFRMVQVTCKSLQGPLFVR